MGNVEKKLKQLKDQIRELFRLAEEAESCGQLLRQQAESHQRLLADANLTEEQLDAVLAEKPQPSLPNQTGFAITEGLM